MREILFRGKRIDNGEWVKGFLSKSRNIEEKPALLKPCIDYEEKGVMMSSIVDPETVGQYTGLTDKNGVKIFEGDIVQVEDYRFAVKFGKSGGVKNVDHEVGYIGFYVIPVGKDAELFIETGLRTDILYWINARNVSIIGNIHDNPELLKAERNDENDRAKIN